MSSHSEGDCVLAGLHQARPPLPGFREGLGGSTPGFRGNEVNWDKVRGSILAAIASTAVPWAYVPSAGFEPATQKLEGA